MEASHRRQLLAKIKDLESQRNKHERIIEKLLNETPSTTRSSQIEHLQMNENKHQSKQNIADQITNRSNASLSCQVNLDTYLTGHSHHGKHQQQSVNSSYQQNASRRQLHTSLAQQFPQRDIRIAPINSSSFTFSLVSSQKFVDFVLIADYLSRNDLWEEVFVTEANNTQFYACVYPQFCAVEPGQYICLSNLRLQQQQHSLVIENTADSKQYQRQEQQDDGNSDSGNSGSDSSSKQRSPHSPQSICIGYLLLHRLLSRIGSGHAPRIFQQLFGYPFQSFSLQQTKSYLSLLEHAKQPEPSCPILLLAELAVNGSLQRVPLQSLNKLAPSKLVAKYTRMTIVREMETICSKELAVVHRRNHHAVVDIDTTEQEQPSLCWVSFVCSGQTHGNGKIKFCLISEQGEIIKYSQPYQSQRQAVRLTLMPNCEYKLYLSQATDNVESELSEFKVVLQSSAPVNHIELSLKLNESYNSMTETIINRYLTSSPHLDQIEKELISLSHTKPKSDLLIVRANLQLMGLAVDFISVQDHARRKARQIEVSYSGEETLCDQQYKKNKKIIKSTLPQIYQIYLSKRMAIQGITGFSYSFTQLNL